MRQGEKIEKVMKNRKIYIRLILTYLAVFLIPLVINLNVLDQIADFTQENISRSVLNNLDHARDSLDKNFREIDTIVEKLTNDSTIRYIATQMNESNKYVEISKLLSAQNLMSAMQIQTFVDEYYLFFHNSEMVISPEHIFQNEDDMADWFSYDGIGWPEWEELMKENYFSSFFPEAYTIQNREGSSMVLYVQSLITIAGANGTFVFPIRSEDIAELLKDTYVSDAGWAYLLDDKGETLVSISSAKGEFELVPQEYLDNGKSIQEVNLSGRRVEIIQTTSMETGLTFVAVLPQEYISSRIYNEQKDTFRLMVIAVMIGLGCILLVSWNKGRKIDQILQILFRTGAGDKGEVKGDEMIYI